MTFASVTTAALVCIATGVSAAETDAESQGGKAEEASAGAATPDGSAGAAEGSEGSEGDRFELDVQESLSTKRLGVPQESPAIITTVPTTEMIRSGHLTLNDYLTGVPGFHATSAYWHDWPGVRGVRGSVNFMIDGVSYTSPVDYRYPAGYGLFLEEFDRFEMISGPAGVLWGAHSLLGTVNALTAPRGEESLQTRSVFGASDLHRFTVRDDRSVGDGKLRLFAGYASLRKPVANPTQRVEGVRPFADQLYITEEGGAPTSPSADTFAVVSARYSGPTVTAYLRLPAAREWNQVSELGAILPAGIESHRDSLNPFGFVTLHNTFLNGQLAILGRAVWYGLYESDSRWAFPASDVVAYDSRALQEIWMSQLSAVGEISYRLLGTTSMNVLAGVEGSTLLPHSSHFFQADPVAGGLLVEQGEVVASQGRKDLTAGRTPSTASAYLSTEVQAFERFSLAGGARYNQSNTYLDVWLFQAGTGLRLIGKSYLKFNYTEGFRPPTLLDRTGIQPVLGRSTLEPERATAIQAELNAAGSIPGFVRRAFGRVDYSQTTVDSLIVREGLRFQPYRLRPVSTPGLNITSVEAFGDAELVGGFILQGMYERTITRNAVSETDESQVSRELANHGPQHRWMAALGMNVGEYMFMRGFSRGQCGGLRYAAGADSNLLGDKLGCYPLFGFSLQAPIEASPVQITLSVDNIANTKMPSAYFSQPELVGAEAPVPSTTSRSVFIMLTWVNAGGEG